MRTSQIMANNGIDVDDYELIDTFQKRFKNEMNLYEVLRFYRKNISDSEIIVSAMDL